MKNIILALAVILCGLTARSQEPIPKDADKYYITVFTHADWAKRPEEKALIEAIRSEPLRSTVLAHRFNHYTTNMGIYKSRWADKFPEEVLPVIIRQKPDGGYVYKASGQNIPSGARAILNDMKLYNQLIPGDHDSADELAPAKQDEFDPEAEEDGGSRRPFIRPRDEEYPDSADIVGRDTPIRDTLASAAMMLTMLGYIVMGVIVLVAFGVTVRLITPYIGKQ